MGTSAEPRSPPFEDEVYKARVHSAYHEAGHALLWYLLGIPFTEATILEWAEGSSTCITGKVVGNYPIPDAPPEARDTARLGLLAIGYGGLIGEQWSPYWYTQQARWGWKDDLEQNERWLTEWYPEASAEERAIIRLQANELAYHRLMDESPSRPENVDRLKRLAEALLHHGTLNYEQTVHVIIQPLQIRGDSMWPFSRTQKDNQAPNQPEGQGTPAPAQSVDPNRVTGEEREKLARYTHEENMAKLRQQDRQNLRTERAQRRADRLAERQQRRQERHDQVKIALSRLSASRARKRDDRQRQMARGGLRHAVHRFGHRYLKLLFVTALAASTSLFFIGRAVPNPPVIIIIAVGGVLGVAIELSYYTVSCDLTDAITDGHKSSAVLNFFYTLVGAGASWFFFTNAALHVGWAPVDDLIGLPRTAWAMIAGALVVGIIFVLSARREHPESATDLQAMARFVMLNTPDYSEEERLLALASMANALRAARQGQALAAPEPAVEALSASRLPANQSKQIRSAVMPSNTSQQGQVERSVSIPAVSKPDAGETDHSDLPMPGVRETTSPTRTNHHNHGDMSGSYERWGGEGEGTDGNSFRRSTN